MEKRALTYKEKEQRGCAYCTDRVGLSCKHPECPYHELDNFRRYDDYLKEYPVELDKVLARKQNRPFVKDLPNRRCGGCRGVFHQQALVRTKQSPNGWYCCDCYKRHTGKKNPRIVTKL